VRQALAFPTSLLRTLGALAWDVKVGTLLLIVEKPRQAHGKALLRIPAASGYSLVLETLASMVGGYGEALSPSFRRLSHLCLV
jgi:hypothetical protein